MESLNRENQLYSAFKRDDVESLKELLKEDNFSDYGSSNGTLLHEVASRGHVDFARVILHHRPDLATRVDSQLRRPLHLASANGQVQMVKLLVRENNDVCLMVDELGNTPLHLAAMVNDGFEVVDELIRGKPELVMHSSNKAKIVAIIQTYVLRRGLEALEALQLVVEVDPTFLNSQDGEGNTLLHKVVALKKFEMLESIISKFQLLDVDLNLKNRNNLTVVDLIDQMPRDSESKKLQKLILGISKINYVNNDEGWFEKKKNGIIVAATIIAVMAYQAVVNPPGGVWGNKDAHDIDSHGNNITMILGTSILAATQPKAYNIFSTLNAISFIGALSIIVVLIHGSPHKVRMTMFRFFLWKIYKFLLSCALLVITTTLAVSYAIAVYSVTPNAEGFNWKKIEDLVVVLILFWLGLICLVIFVNLYRFFSCVRWRRGVGEI